MRVKKLKILVIFYLIMRSKTAILFSILVVLAMVFVAFTFVYREKTNAFVGNYAKSIASCGNIIDEKECYNNDYCEGIYGPNCPTCQDVEFKSCQRLSDKALSQINGQKTTCQESGGQWYRNKLGSFCLCQLAGANKVWDKNQGCINK